jgi:hypothetical protein
MGIWMKTTVEISDALLDEARRQAVREGTTVRALIDDGLRRVLRTGGKTKAFKLRRATFKGRGLQPGIAPGSWERLRELVYEGRGA